MELEVLTIARYREEQSPRSTLLFAKGSYSDVKPHRWEEFTLSGLRIGDAVFKGKAIKKDEGWRIKERFVVVEGGQERILELKPEDVEELCNLAFRDEKGLEKKLCELAKVDGKMEGVERIAGIGIEIEQEEGGHLEFQAWEDGGKLVHKKLSFYGFEIGGWKVSADFRKVGAKKWDVKGAIAKKGVEVKDGVIEEEVTVREQALEVELRNGLNRFVKGVFSIGNKDRQGRDIGRFEVEGAIEELSSISIPFGKRKSMKYTSGDERLRVFAGRFFGGEWWRVVLDGEERVGSEKERIEKLTELMEDTLKTKDDSHLLEYCRGLFKKTRGLRR